jgi:hypothetical protein
MLGSLNLVEIPKASSSRFVAVKIQLLDRLAQQLKAATQMVNGEPSSLSDRQKWYFKVDDEMNFKVKVLNRTLTLAKNGKTELQAIKVGQDKNAPVIIQQVIDAVEAGELDGAIKAEIKARAAK